MNLLECKNVSKKYGKNEDVLNSLNLKIETGKVYGLFGKNGSGKTTLLKLINDLLTLDSGEILFNNQKIGVYSKSKISYLPEKSYLDIDMNVKSIINMFNDFYVDFDMKKANRLLKKFNIDYDLEIYKMSKGKQKIFQLILVMSRKASLYILDEPFDGIDSISLDYILEMITSNKSKNSSIIISTHLISNVKKILDEVIVLDNKKVVIENNIKELEEKEKKNLEDILKVMFK